MNTNFDLHWADDPRLTAYVLGELGDEERAEIERELVRNPAARQTVEEIRETTDALLADLSTEPELYLTANQRKALEAALDPPRAAIRTSRTCRSWRSAALATLVSIAAIAVVVMVLPPNSVTSRPVQLGDASRSAGTTQEMSMPEENKERQWSFKAGAEVPLLAKDEASDGGQLYFDVYGMESVEKKDSLAAGQGTRLGVSGTDPTAESDSVDQLSDVRPKSVRRSSERGQFGAISAGSSTPNQVQLKESETITRLEAETGPARYDSLPAAGEVHVTVPAEGLGVVAPNEARLSKDVEAHFGSSPSRRSVLYDSNGNGALGDGLSSFGGMPEESLSRIKKNLDGVSRALPPTPSESGSRPMVEYKKRVAAPQQTTRERSAGEAVESLNEFSDVKLQIAGQSTRSIAAGLPGSHFYVETRHGVPFRRHIHDFKTRLSSVPDTRNEDYEPIIENEYLSPWTKPLSTFSIDVDTGAYANVRRFLNHGQWPPANAVRIEELINYFHYDDPQPEDGHPFAVRLEAAACPWQSDHRLVRIGLKGKEIPREERPPSNLVFLIDVSGSMRDANKLPLVKSALQMLAQEMTEDDRIAIVTYAGKAGVLLDSTSGTDQQTILSAIGNLQAGGSTNGEAGIQLAYEMAVRHFLDGGTNRIILCTDGDFNVGMSDDDQLVRMIRNKASSGVFLSIFGFGMGNLKDAKLEKLADNGNGHYGYVDTLQEARKVFVEELVGTLYTIAKDVKIQVEFNPARVGAYRLIGYENRMMAARDFNDDQKDAGEIGAGHSVTALYEIVPVGKMPPGPHVDPLKYQRPEASIDDAEQAKRRKALKNRKELLTVKLRYKQPDGDRSTRLEFPLADDSRPNDDSSQDFRWAAAVASFGMILRDSQFRGDASLAQVLELAESAKGSDHRGRRQEFIGLVRTAQSLWAANTEADVETVPLSDAESKKKATVGGKYCNLLKRIKVPDDVKQYGPFKDFGYWDGQEYAGHSNLPKGYWVYVAPYWYIWKDTTAPSARR